ncbi:helix-turn-helix domain-containing protein [Streptomyces lunaelactis]|uniref:helix-turn-helix domain-containing protein n=1 Tax=Streptomyces lunaelactis TaxID=1535768 RepID=UPI001584865D|nr:helix-turn-helix transcriptional regulator [Streptomyces lunaelactis]NUK10672.1 helix-turn-helix domain-containing protein [Streptomyces lunaelactis]NUK25551.1 helix-turn-helix domain-containing protein [Streptomyces lunaelactis]NUL12604.1 helix-turn-helix domain-containing protein [Streptomyces lunaelactis]NUL25796.1 helix-turn-helix domain-containing protein [Streptomyces lunaelactis]
MATPEAEEFAALLRELKDRSGRSYGVLAGKLHVSTSTLHRYCNGDAVPTEYAPVERLARLCAATPDEHVELHRRWILADGARRRARAEGAAPETVPEAAAVPPAASGVVPGTVAPVAVAGTVQEPAEPEAVPGAETVLAARTRNPKRLRIALAAGAVVALAVPAAFIASHAATQDPDGKGKPVAGASAPPGTAASPRTPSASPSGSAAPSASPSGSPSASPSPSRAATPPATVGVPLRVGISSYNWDSPCGQYYLLDQEPDAVPPPPAPQDNRGWARALGGVDGGHMQLQLTATGKSADSVVLNAVHVRVVGRNAPLDWKAYSMGDGCGSGVTPQTFDVDLDAAHPLVKPVAGQNGDTVVPAKDFPYKVASNDPQVLNLDVHTEGHDISWYLELDWSSGDRRGTVRVDDGGEPFRTSAIEGRTEYGYWPDKGEWVARSGQ